MVMVGGESDLREGVRMGSVCGVVMRAVVLLGTGEGDGVKMVWEVQLSSSLVVAGRKTELVGKVVGEDSSVSDLREGVMRDAGYSG